MAAPKAPLLDSAGKKSKDVTLEATVFGVELKPHLIHETVRAEMNAARAGTQAAKNRALVSGGRAKPWRQKGTGRARAGTSRAPHWTGGGVAFAPTPRDYEVKVNRKARRSALRGVLSQHAADGTLGVLDGSGFKEPSTRTAVDLLAYPSGHHDARVRAHAAAAGYRAGFTFLNGRVLPDLWMEHATGRPVVAEPMLEATEAALRAER